MTELSFTLNGGVYLSDEFSSDNNIVLHLNFADNTSCELKLERTVDDSHGWACAYSTVISTTVWEDTIVGAASSISLRLAISKEPVYAGYEELS